MFKFLVNFAGESGNISISLGDVEEFSEVGNLAFLSIFCGNDYLKTKAIGSGCLRRHLILFSEMIEWKSNNVFVREKCGHPKTSG